MNARMSKHVKPASNKSPLLNSRPSKQGSHVLSGPESFRAIEPQYVQFPPLRRVEQEQRLVDLEPHAAQAMKSPDCPPFESMRDMQLLSEEIDKEMTTSLKKEP